MGLREEALPPGSRSLLNDVRRLVDFCEQALEAKWVASEKFPEPGRELVRSITCDDFSQVLRELSQTLIPALRGSTATRVPVELEALLKAQVHAMPCPWPAVVMFASSAYNYSIQSYNDPLAQLGPLIDPRASTSPSSGQRYLFLSLPELERDSALLHTIMVGHELGHYRDWEATVTDALPLAAPSAWLDPSGGLLPDYAEVESLFAAIAASWAREIVSDVFAAITFGPASLWALMELLSNVTTFTGDSLSHPAGDRRLSLILAVLDAHGFRKVPEVDQLLQDFDSYASAAATRSVTLDRALDARQQEAADAAWAWLLATFPQILSACVGAVPHSMSPASWTEVIKVAEGLQTGRPMGESRNVDGSIKAIAYEVIINAGWLTRVENYAGLARILDMGQEARDVAELGAVMDGLILKSIETSALRAVP